MGVLRVRWLVPPACGYARPPTRPSEAPAMRWMRQLTAKIALDEETLHVRRAIRIRQGT
jgi:hypothetical protein